MITCAVAIQIHRQFLRQRKILIPRPISGRVSKSCTVEERFVVEHHERREAFRKCVECTSTPGDLENIGEPLSGVNAQAGDVWSEIEKNFFVCEGWDEFRIQEDNIGRFVSGKCGEDLLFVLASGVGLIQHIDVRIQFLELGEGLLVEGDLVQICPIRETERNSLLRSCWCAAGENKEQVKKDSKCSGQKRTQCVELPHQFTL